MAIKLGIIMDPIGHINPKKDSSLAMLQTAQQRGWQIHYMEHQDLYIDNSVPMARMQYLHVKDDENNWYQLGTSHEQALNNLDAILMRIDPPFNMEYIYTTYLLELAEQGDTLIVNKPRSLRDVNEKHFSLRFPQCCPESVVTANQQRIKDFLAKHHDIICKPLDGMGGASIFRVQDDDPNINVILETLTQTGKKTMIAQRYLPEIKDGDKRILLIDGEPIDYALARIPTHGETRANLAAGGIGVTQKLSERDRWICQQVGPTLRDMGLLFVGLDVIGDYLTEINVTSPTCIREIEAYAKVDVTGPLLDCIEKKLGSMA